MLSKLKRHTKEFIYIFINFIYFIYKFPYKHFLKRKTKKIVYVWIIADFSLTSLKDFFLCGIVKSLALTSALLESGYDVKLKIGKKIGFLNNKIIFFEYSRTYFTVYKMENYLAEFVFIAKQLVSQNNLVYPPLHERLFWENKAYMHEWFEKLGIRCPKTYVFENAAELIDNLPLEYPFLLKEEHSANSDGIYLVLNENTLKKTLSRPIFCNRESKIIIQKLLNIRRDMRVILVGNKIISYYWRINPNVDWKPTTTKLGSYVKYGDFPEKWREHIIQNFMKLKISTGAFDLAWENDDLTTEPFYLEVSPSYETKPYINLERLDTDYHSYIKKHWFFYRTLFLREQYRIHSIVAKEWISCFLK